MPLHASTAELRLALVAFAAAASGMSTARCRDLMDATSEGAANAPREVIEALDLTPGARLGAVRLVATVCASCGACPRGQAARQDETRIAAE